MFVYCFLVKFFWVVVGNKMFVKGVFEGVIDCCNYV